MGKSKTKLNKSKSKVNRLKDKLKKHQKKVKKLKKKLKGIKKNKKNILKINSIKQKKPKKLRFTPKLLKSNNNIKQSLQNNKNRVVMLAYRVFLISVQYEDGSWNRLNQWTTHHINVTMPTKMSISEFKQKHNNQLMKLALKQERDETANISRYWVDESSIDFQTTSERESITWNNALLGQIKMI